MKHSLVLVLVIWALGCGDDSPDESNSVVDNIKDSESGITGVTDGHADATADSAADAAGDSNDNSWSDTYTVADLNSDDPKTAARARQALYNDIRPSDPTGENRWDDAWGTYPGDSSALQAVFWERDGIAEDDPEYGYNDGNTIYDEGTTDVQMGVFIRSVHPTLISQLDFVVEYDATHLEFDRVERHWSSVKLGEPGEITNVELLQPGRLSFSYDSGDTVLYSDPYDRTIASMHFKVLAPGSSWFTLYHPPAESWSEWKAFNYKMDKPWAESSPNAAIIADGTTVPFHWEVICELTVR